MIFRTLTTNHDWTFGAGKGNYASGDIAIGLDINTRILSWIGDCFFDQTAGIDWVNRLGSYNQKTLLENDIRSIILKSYGVTGILNFDASLVGRDFSATYNIITINSPSFINTLNTSLYNA